MPTVSMASYSSPVFLALFAFFHLDQLRPPQRYRPYDVDETGSDTLLHSRPIDLVFRSVQQIESERAGVSAQATRRFTRSHRVSQR
jgi:hypothetical protein